ncbi:MAG: hypothetical protein AAF310_06240 [Myxococcota bacterium]
MTLLDRLQGTVLAPLPHCAQIQLTGADTLAVMHRLSTQHCSQLQPGHSCINTLLTPKGRTVALLHQLVLPNNGLLLLGQPNQQQQIFDWIDKHIFIENIQLLIADQQHTLWWLIGHQAASTLQPLLNHPIPTTAWHCLPHHNDLLIRTFNCIDAQGQPTPAWLLRACNAPHSQLLQALQEHQHIYRCNSAETEAIRIAAGIPRHSNEINDQTNPLQLGLHAAIHTNKGCYIGQEVISRLLTYNKVKGQLVKISCNQQTHQQLQAGQQLYLSKQQLAIGHITSVSPLFTPQVAVALGLVKLPADITLPTDGLLGSHEAGAQCLSMSEVSSPTTNLHLGNGKQEAAK